MSLRGGRTAEMAQTYCRTDCPADVEERSIIKKLQRLVGISIFNSMFVYEGRNYCHLIGHWKGGDRCCPGLTSFFPQYCRGAEVPVSLVTWKFQNGFVIVEEGTISILL